MRHDIVSYIIPRDIRLQAIFPKTREWTEKEKQSYRESQSRKHFPNFFMKNNVDTLKKDTLKKDRSIQKDDDTNKKYLKERLDLVLNNTNIKSSNVETERRNLQMLSNQNGKYIPLTLKKTRKLKRPYYYDIVNDIVVLDMNCANRETCLFKDIFVNHKYLPINWKEEKLFFQKEIEEIKNSTNEFEFI